ncbi:pol polyprotein-like protein, partial [Leptotrombidium deliense]
MTRKTNKRFIICYYSRTLKHSERNLSAIEIELLAIISSIKHFIHYLLGRHFLIYTDSNPLVYLMRTKNIFSKLTRWAIFLQDFDFEIIYTKGVDNTMCDYLSRYPLNNKIENKTEDEEFLNFEPLIDSEFNPLFFEEFDCSINFVTTFLIDALLVELNDIKQLQRNDKFYSLIFETLEGKIKGKNKSIRKAANNYEIKDAKLYRVIILNNEFKSVLAIPKCLVNNVLNAMHDDIISGGHTGIRKTFERIKIRFHWRSMYSDVVKYVRSCTVCQCTKNRMQKVGMLKPVTPGNRPFSKVGIDIVGLLPQTKSGNRYIIVATCYLTKYTLTKAVKNI